MTPFELYVLIKLDAMISLAQTVTLPALCVLIPAIMAWSVLWIIPHV